MKVLHEVLTATTREEKQALLSSLQEQFVVICHQYSCLQMLIGHRGICLQPLMSCSNLKCKWDYRSCLQPLLLDWHLPTLPEATSSTLSGLLSLYIV